MPNETSTLGDSGDPGREGLTGAVVHGLKWSYASTIVTVVLQIGVTAVLARLLSPADFGLVAMAVVFLRFGQYFAQMGAGQAIVQRPELSRRDVHTAFTSAALLGVVFSVLFVVLAPLVELLFPDAEDVVAVTRVMAIGFTLAGMTTTTQALLRRRFAFRAIALAEIGSYVLGYAAVGLVLALMGAGAWSLVTASLVQAGLAMVVYVVLCRRDLGLALARQSLKGIYSFGGRVSVIGFLEFLAGNLDTLWAGHVLGAKATGLYSRATNLANLPLYYFTTSLSRVLLPAYSRIQEQRERLHATYLETVTVVAAIAMPLSWGVAGASRSLVLGLLGDQWLDAVPVLAILSLAVPFTLVTHFGAIICEATATLGVKIVITLSRLAWLTALLLVGAPYGVVGIALAFAVSELLTHAAYLVVMRRMLAIRAASLWGAYSQGLGSGVVVGIALYGVDAALTAAGVGVFIRLALSILTGALLLILSVTQIRGGRVWKDVRGRLRAAA